MYPTERYLLWQTIVYACDYGCARLLFYININKYTHCHLCHKEDVKVV